MQEIEVQYEPINETITREMVAAEDNADTLRRWLETQGTIQAEISAMISALKAAGVEPTYNVARKLGYIRISIGWIVRRMQVLGIDHDAPDGRALRQCRHQLTMVQQSIATKNKKLAALRARVAELEAKLSTCTEGKSGE